MKINIPYPTPVPDHDRPWNPLTPLTGQTSGSQPDPKASTPAPVTTNERPVNPLLGE